MQLASFVITSIPLLITFYANKYRNDDFEKTLEELGGDLTLPRITEYDFIIVGAGAAGCVVANKLSEHYTVLLLEAGGDPVPTVEVPLFRTFVESNENINYVYNSIPQQHINGRVIRKSIGKMMGGSTSVNALIYQRGHPTDYDNWAAIVNDSSWRYENVLEYFKMSENYNVDFPFLENTDEHHGTGGPMRVELEDVPSTQLWMRAGLELGLDYKDPNPQRERKCFGPLVLSRENGRRVSSYTAFIKSIKSTRDKLTIIRYADVQEILFDEDKSAYGVSFLRHGFPQIAHAKNEVIISGGAFGSPLLLMKSGVGPKAMLEAANIPIVADLPVGEKLSDHCSVGVRNITINNSSLFPDITELTQSSIQNYINYGNSTLLERPGPGGTWFHVSESAKAAGENDWPNIAIEYGTAVSTNQPNVPVQISLNVRLFRPKMVGTVKMDVTKYLAGERNDEELALIDYNILADPIDIDDFVEGRYICRVSNWRFKLSRILQHLKKLTPSMTEFMMLDVRNMPSVLMTIGGVILSKGETTTTTTHMVATCAMGSVVDSKLNVLGGVSNLRVIDLSIAPVVPAGNTAAPAFMIGQKGAAMILEKWGTTQEESAGQQSSVAYLSLTMSLLIILSYL